MLLCGNAGHRLEPVRVMRCAVLHSPFAHRACDHIRNGRVNILAVCNGLVQGLVDRLRQALLHHGVIEHKASEYISRFHNLSSFLYFASVRTAAVCAVEAAIRQINKKTATALRESPETAPLLFSVSHHSIFFRICQSPDRNFTKFYNLPMNPQ